MRLPARIIVPVAAALVVVGGFIALLFTQLEDTRAMLSQQLTMAIGSGSSLTSLLPGAGSTYDRGDASITHLRTGDVHALRGEWTLAYEQYQHAVDAGGGSIALRKLAQAQLQRRDIRGARTTVDQLRREGAREEDVFLLETMLLLRTGEITKARALAEAAQESPHKHYALALLAIIAGNHEAARQELTTVTEGWEPILRAYARTLTAAYDEYALFPESPPLHLHTLLGRALAQVQECELALPILSQVTHSQDDYRDAWIVQGFCELSTERTAEALASLERAYHLDPEKPEIQYFLARAYIAQDDHANALTFLQYALRNGFEPAAEVRILIAQSALEIGNATLALEQYESLTHMTDASVDTFDTYVTAAITAGRFEEAYVKAQEAVQRWPDDGRAHFLLGWSAAETNRPDEARAELTKALELDPSLERAKEKREKL